MSNVEENFAKGKRIDVHKRDWTVHVVCEGKELYHGTLPPDPQRLIRLLKRFQAQEIRTVYETGATRYRLHEALTESGVDSMVVEIYYFFPSAVSNISIDDGPFSRYCPLEHLGTCGYLMSF